MTTLTYPAPETKEAVRSPATLSQAFGKLLSLKGTDATEVYLIRHAEPDYPAARDSHDPWDPPLTSAGREQAMRLATRMQRLALDAVYSSTMARAQETAAFIAAIQGLHVRRVGNLREVGFDPEVAFEEPANGLLNGEELAQRFLNRPRWDALPGFEASREFRHRVVQAIEAIIARHPGERVAIVAHGGVINAYLSMVLGIERDMFFLPIHSSVSTLRVREDLYALDRINDVAHLSPALQTY